MMSEDKDTKEVPEADVAEAAETVEDTEDTKVTEEAENEVEETEAAEAETGEASEADEEDQDGPSEDGEEEDGDDDHELTDAEKVQLLTEQLTAASEKYMRLRADVDNIRKRRVREMDDLRRNTKIDTLDQVLPVMDQFQMAVSAMQDSSDPETIKQGMEMILNTFKRCFENLGVESVSTVGQEFDPNQHEAIATEASDEVEAEFIISEWKAGYKLGDHLFRPAVVVVSSGPADEGDAVEAEAGDQADNENDGSAVEEADAAKDEA